MAPLHNNQKIYYYLDLYNESGSSRKCGKHILYFISHSKYKNLNSRAVDVMQSIFGMTQSILRHTCSKRSVAVFLLTDTARSFLRAKIPSRAKNPSKDSDTFTVSVDLKYTLKYTLIDCERINEIAGAILGNYEEAYNKRRWTILKILDRIWSGLGYVTELDRMRSLNKSIDQNTKSIDQNTHLATD